jgi:hypothetical protein
MQNTTKILAGVAIAVGAFAIVGLVRRVLARRELERFEQELFGEGISEDTAGVPVIIVEEAVVLGDEMDPLSRR